MIWSEAAMISGPIPSPCATGMGTRFDALYTVLLDQRGLNGLITLRDAMRLALGISLDIKRQ
jgi:hypothetical protein